MVENIGKLLPEIHRSDRSFFDFIDDGLIKIRVMFTQNMYRPRNLTNEHWENEYFILYYQFIKHAFGLLHHPIAKLDDHPINLRVYLDHIPDTDERKQKFRAYLCSLDKNPEFRSARIRVQPESVTDVVSHEHDILQCLDIILGSMQFRLNDKHLEKPEGARRRGKRTLAKEAVYKRINVCIRRLRKGFTSASALAMTATSQTGGTTHIATGGSYRKTQSWRGSPNGKNSGPAAAMPPKGRIPGGTWDFAAGRANSRIWCSCVVASTTSRSNSLIICKAFA